ncbi:IclR family transcriptional regulator [Xylophilus sp. GOD-11R]|uniref:IclR family transcriptional regulator n=1 Tax=Xylophilus sp. GOD-11R TaxID=3089814 RepID=UPI00298C33C0|nr:IclR family transcriptional regulator [Xylophilus sp. GOD-11R]WPB56510.1 IclR family transcriptional regulator [Xylophilus sp. GOD-11R]
MKITPQPVKASNPRKAKAVTALARVVAPSEPSNVPPAGVLERGIAVLQCFREDRLRLSLRELAAISGLDKATLLRLLGVLIRANMVYRFESGVYSLGPATLHMGMLYRASFDLATRLQPVLHAVMRQTGETVAFYVRSGDERVCLYRENTLKELRHHVEPGTRLPLAAGGASAHVLLHFTGGATPLASQIVDQGYVITRGERVPEMASIALPVFEGDGSFMGALVVIGLASRHPVVDQLKGVATARQQLAAQGFAAEPPAAWRSRAAAA